jgi:hypothetical protein
MPRLGLLALTMLLVAAPVAAREVAGVALHDTVDVAGQALRLNGAGLRTRFFFKVYVVGLYLPRPTHSAVDVLQTDGPRRIVLHLLRALDGPEIAHAIAEAFASNAGGAMPRLRERLTRLEAMFPGVQPGDTIELTMADGRTAVAVNGTTRGTIDGADFARALLAVWLGPDPVDPDLKRELLGEELS